MEPHTPPALFAEGAFTPHATAAAVGTSAYCHEILDKQANPAQAEGLQGSFPGTQHVAGHQLIRKALCA